HIGYDRAVRQLRQALADDFRALPHLLHADPIPVVRVAVLSDGDFPFHLVIGAVGLGLADVVGDAGPAQDRAGTAEIDGVFGGNHGDVLGPRQPDAVVQQELVVLVEV